MYEKWVEPTCTCTCIYVCRREIRIIHIHVHVHDVIGDVERKKERKTPEAMEK